jgi:hypothetical protein
MVDMRTGHIAYGVVELHPDGKGSREIAVPWNALYPDRIDDRLLIDAPRSRIESAPAMRARRSGVDREWARAVHHYFNCSPYWESELH